MKELADGTKVSSMTYYFLLDWNDRNNKIFMAENFKKESLKDLTIDEYATLFSHASTEEHQKLLKLFK